MRATLLSLFFCLASSATCMAQSDWAAAMFDHSRHDFGVVARGAKVEHRFFLENIYLEDMRIASVTSTCTCTTAAFPKTPIKTYEKVEIVATVDTRNFLGHKEATLRVVFADPFPAEVQLHVYCYIRSDVVFDPGEIQFGKVDQGSEVRRKVTVRYAGRSDWQITDILSTWPHLAASVSEVSRTAGSVIYDLWVTLKPDAPVGYIRDHLILVTNDHNPDARRVPVAVEGVVVSPISVVPSPLPLGVVQAGQSVTRNLVVRGKAPFRVLDVTAPDERFHFKLPEEAAPVQLIPVTFNAGDATGKVTGTIRIQTDLGGKSALEVKVDGMVLPQAAESSSARTPPAGDADPPASNEAGDWHSSGN